MNAGLARVSVRELRNNVLDVLRQADPGLRDELAAFAGSTDDLNDPWQQR